MPNFIEQKVLELNRTLPYESAGVFRFFVSPELLEQWSAPDTMTLEVPKMEARKEGEYRYIHADKAGAQWVCEGHFKDFQRNVRLVTLDTVTNPKGELVLKDLETIVDFKDFGGTTEVHIRMKGFKDLSSMRDCKQGWTQCLDKLEPLMAMEGSHHHRRIHQENARV